MKVADEPAYLTVGTDVSAKYRGAFCEAKIKTVKRIVKVKVVLKGDSTSQVVQDDQVKGPLRVGSTVEVKSPEGRHSEAVISKLTDASWYTVVFDDGDEKTLRRTSLCLKGERHFAESETLDQLPLTNPEHFGTPVIGKKTNRGRRSSQAVLKPFSSNNELIDYGTPILVPDNWKVNLSEILESSSSDEEDDDEDGEGKKGEEEEKEPEPEEPDPEERDHFLQQLYKFMEDRGTPINKPPVLGYKDLNLFKLFRLVHVHGGCDNIESGSIWKQIYMDLGIPVLNSAASYNVKTAYRKYLYGFEEYCRSAQIQFRTVHHNEPRPDPQPEVQCVKTSEKESEDPDEMMQQVTAEPGTSEEKPAADADESDAESEKGRKDICSPRVSVCLFFCWAALSCSASCRAKTLTLQVFFLLFSMIWSFKNLCVDEESNRSCLVDRDEMEEDDCCEDSEHSVTGTKIKVRYGKGKTQKIYEANIRNTETDNGEVLYLVHYYGWNIRYDEWIKADRIIWPVDKGGTKRKQKKKVKNKEDGEEDKQAKQVIRRGRPPLKSTPPSTSRSVSKTPSSEGRSGSKTSRPTDASTLPNGEGKTVHVKSSENLPEEITMPEPAQTEPEIPSSTQEMPNFKERESKPEEDTSLLPVASDDGSTKPRVKKPHLKEPGSETPTQTPATANHIRTEEPSTPLQPAKIPQKRPYSPLERITHVEITSDTDSATEDFGPSEQNAMKSEMPALTREVHLRVEPPCPELEDPTTTANEEMMPQIGPEALVCHEVDLDDPEEKDRPSGEELLLMMKEEKTQPLEPSDQLPHVLAAVGPPLLFSPSSAPSPDESHSTKSESDTTIEVDSVAESQEGLGENESTHSFDASASSSNSSISLQDRDGKDRGQKRLLDCTTGLSAKKQKRSQKRSSTVCKTEKNGAGHSSDSEDLSAMDSSNKLTPVKHSSLPKSQKLSRSPGLVSPNIKDMEKDKHKEKQSIPSPRTYKWSCQLTELDNMSSAERISFLQEKLQEIRKYYLSLKSEVASIDRRRKRLKKKEREVSHTTASTSSGSSDTGMSPSSASPTQNTVAVECR
uniref:AT rich interactive domain 4A (RBP1-like) n=1 Tax=Sinocyclocheilus anshuiensis TaxID=1608454 RepID=A0A671LGC7_9TELE